VPYPKDADTFWQLVKLGGELRQLHLLESPVVSQLITTYPVGGDNVVVKPWYEAEPMLDPGCWMLDAGSQTADGGSQIPDNSQIANHTSQIGKVWINETQYFAGVPLVAWEFYIGGYQPAQKWLKDRKGRVLNFEDILHYQKVIVALAETGRVMGEIDGIQLG